MSQTLIVVTFSQWIWRAGHHMVHLNHVQVYWSIVVSVKLENSFSHAGTILNEALRKSIKRSLIP